MPVQHIARGPRGDASLMDDRSITARKYQEGLLLKETRGAAITRTKNWLASNQPIEIVLDKAGRAFAVPRPVYEFLRAEAEAD